MVPVGEFSTAEEAEAAAGITPNRVQVSGTPR
jgi:hypothetical protein